MVGWRMSFLVFKGDDRRKDKKRVKSGAPGRV